jgi:hypothetical protein
LFPNIRSAAKWESLLPTVLELRECFAAKAGAGKSVLQLGRNVR